MSSPSDYIQALKKEGKKLKVKLEDGFPYSNVKRDYWSGFYTSRPALKKMTRDFSALMNA